MSQQTIIEDYIYPILKRFHHKNIHNMVYQISQLTAHCNCPQAATICLQEDIENIFEKL